MQTAEYAVAAKIAMEPAFAWWVPYTLKKWNRIISKVKSKYWLRTHKFGIQIPKSVEEAKRLDQENGDSRWWEAICNKMRNIRPAFEVWEKDVEHIPPGYQQIKCHMIFDVKMGGATPGLLLGDTPQKHPHHSPILPLYLETWSGSYYSPRPSTDYR